MPDYKINIWHKGKFVPFCGYQNKPHAVPELEQHHKKLLCKIWPQERFAIFIREGKGKKFEFLKELE